MQWLDVEMLRRLGRNGNAGLPLPGLAYAAAQRSQTRMHTRRGSSKMAAKSCTVKLGKRVMILWCDAAVPELISSVY
jgi:hypothetical protein